MSVIVPAYEAASTIPRALRAIAAQDLHVPFEVIVVDDGSTDATAELAAGVGGVVVLSQPNLGPAAARNLGAAHATGSILAFTDADCYPRRDWLGRGVAAMENTDLLQGAVIPDPEARRHPLERTVAVRRESGLFESANLFVRRSLFEALGGFEDWLEASVGKPMAEDAWLGWRAQREGARVRFSDHVVVEHEVFAGSARALLMRNARLVYFPAIVRKMPELRRSLILWLFLTPRSAAFDAAALGFALAAVGPSWALLAALPYGWLNLRSVLRWRRHAPLALAAELAADVVGAMALLIGTVRFRTPVL